MEADKRRPRERQSRANPGPLILALLIFAAAILAIHARLDHLSMHLIYARFSSLALPAVLIAMLGMLASLWSHPF